MSEKRRPITIAVDFDGTVVEHRYPTIGETLPEAFDVLIELQEKGYRLILWTYREGDLLKEAVDFCIDNGIMFYAVNHSAPDEEYNKYMSRKIDADVFIDDRNIGGFIGWENIRRILLPNSPNIKENNMERSTNRKKKGFFNKLFE